VYGPVRTVVWQGSAGDRRPYADSNRGLFMASGSGTATSRDVRDAFEAFGDLSDFLESISYEP
jgi:hypothetical protein